MEKKWFKRRNYGWGWAPATWQGWVVLILFVAVVVLIALTTDFERRTSMGYYLIKVLLAVTVLLVVTFIKGEKPRWQWGKTKEDDQA